MRTLWGITKMAVLGSLCFASASAQLFGQANVGSIVGNVKDMSGGVIVGATVNLIDPATREQRTMQTNQLGDYVFNGVRPPSAKM
ncbi:MAG: carboxypeptidase-like regulatory domain-containing protein [Terriglobia bacterium]